MCEAYSSSPETYFKEEVMAAKVTGNQFFQNWFIMILEGLFNQDFIRKQLEFA